MHAFYEVIVAGNKAYLKRQFSGYIMIMEWLETDGLGGFAMGTASGIPMRRYHALLHAARANPAERITLLNAVEAWIIIEGKRIPLSTFSFGSEHVHPNGIQHLKSFNVLPIPTWIYNFEDGEIEHQLFLLKDECRVCLSWTYAGKKNALLELRPFLSGRSYHALHKENSFINLSTGLVGEAHKWQTYPNIPSLFALSNGKYEASTVWFRNVNYNEDRMRGSDFQEDLASPGTFRFELGKKNTEAAMVFSINEFRPKESALKFVAQAKKTEIKRRSKFDSVLSKAADSYIVKRGTGKTIIAGYPWFADWGRDTFISMRGLCLANGRLEDAKLILTEWSKTIKDGMLPNRFIENGEEPEYNSVDASLWFIIACFEFIKLEKRAANFFKPAISTIIEEFIKGTKYNIGVDASDGLLRAGDWGVQLTWMDAKIGEYVVTPRMGKPVEIQALWLNALKISSMLLDKHTELFNQGLNSFKVKFWNRDEECLYDVIDADHEIGKNDAAIRPNQLFAVGGLPFQILEGEMAKSVVKKAEEHLYIPSAIRTLSPKDPKYRGHYVGDGGARDSAYHQGTAWPWLMGPFIEAWLRVNGSSKKAKKEAFERFFKPFISNLDNAGLGHLSEIHDADGPFHSRGCPFQAWSVAEALRLEKSVLA